MNSKKHFLFLLFTFILILFCLSACTNFSEVDLAKDTGSDQAGDEISFQEYLWEEHAIDLAIQVGLMLAGALGVAALLPAPDEE
jgi:hypothetical protein